MNSAHPMSERMARARRELRKELDSSLQRSNGAWWIPSIVACAVWAWLANHERTQHA